MRYARLVAFFPALFAALVGSCFHMQVPRTLPKGEWEAGAGMMLFHPGPWFFEYLPVPSFWARYGLASHIDCGATWLGLGGKGDLKVSLNDYLAAGVGAGMLGDADEQAIVLAEGSFYAGFPFWRLYPYAVVRGQVGTNEYRIVSAVGGLRISGPSTTHLYCEVGRTLFDWRWEEGVATVALGVSLGLR